jgi:hypothetical protein
MHDASMVSLDASHPSEPARWAEQSCEVRIAAGFYPDRQTVDSAYGEQWDGALVLRLAWAGRRLAEVLNDALRPR